MTGRGAGHRYEKQKRHGDDGEEIGRDLQDPARRRAVNDPVYPAPPPGSTRQKPHHEHPTCSTDKPRGGEGRCPRDVRDNHEADQTRCGTTHSDTSP